MKLFTQTLVLALAVLLSNICFAQSLHNSSVISLAGAYTLQKQTANFGNGDSVTGRDQLKIFTGKYMMYVRHRDADTLAEYGIGTYTANSNSVKENIFFDSRGPQDLQFKLAVNRTKNGYCQVIQPDYDAQGHAGVTKEEYVNAADNFVVNNPAMIKPPVAGTGISNSADVKAAPRLAP